MTAPLKLLAVIVVALIGYGCDPAPEACVGVAIVPEWCVRTCEGRSLEFNLDPRFGPRCGFCRCFDPMETQP